MSEMEDSLSMDTLLRMNYRELQQIAKPLGVPCNIKKQFLQEVLYHAIHGTQEQVALVLKQVMQERAIAKREPRKKYERRKEVQRKITGPKEKWDSLMAANCLTPARTIKQRPLQKLDGENDSRASTKRRQPLYSNMRKYTRKQGDSNLIPCDRILRSNLFPICDKLERKKCTQKTGDNHVSSSQDSVDTRTLGEIRENHVDRVASNFNEPSNVQIYSTQHNCNEPVDFSLKKYHEKYSQTNLTLQSMVQYQSINSNSHSTCLTYGTVTQTENYHCVYQPEEKMSVVHNTQVTLYSEDRDNRSVDNHNGKMHSRVAKSYAVDYTTQVPIRSEIYDTADDCEQSSNSTNNTLEAPANCTPPYFHKKIRIKRRLSVRDFDLESQLESEDQIDQAQPYCVAVPQEYNIHDDDATVDTSERIQAQDIPIGTIESCCHIPRNTTLVGHYVDNKSPDSTVNNMDNEIPKMSETVNNSGVIPENEAYDTASCEGSYADVTFSSNGNALPSIADVFPRYCAFTPYLRPLYARIDEVGQVQTQQMEDIKSDTLNLDSDTLLKLHESSVNSLVAPPSPQPPWLSERHEISKGSEPDVADLGTIASQLNSPWSDMEVGASVTVRAPSPVGSWDDVMSMISQEALQAYTTDNVDSVQCVCCDWNGDSSQLERHIKELHHDEMHTFESRLTCILKLSLGALLRERRRAVPVCWHGALFVLLVQYEEPEWIVATVGMLSQHNSSQPIQATLTVYNKLTGEPFSWSAPVLKSNLILCGNPAAHLKMQLSRLGLLANSADVLLWNGQLVVTSCDGKIICGDLSLDEISVDFHLELSC